MSVENRHAVGRSEKTFRIVPPGLHMAEAGKAKSGHEVSNFNVVGRSAMNAVLRSDQSELTIIFTRHSYQLNVISKGVVEKNQPLQVFDRCSVADEGNGKPLLALFAEDAVAIDNPEFGSRI